MTVIPLALLGGIEIGLRLVGYGYSTALFKEIQIGNDTFLVNNDNFSLRFFPPQMARFPGPIRMPIKKPADTYRIFILGESAAMGDPDPTYAASRYLEALLSERFPKTHFEIINLGITAINSHVILPIARDCAAQHGDLWIIYMGNNEMVGPFGAATVFGTKTPPLPLIRFNLAIQKTRLGQLLMSSLRKLKDAKTQTTSWGGMEMFVGNQLAASDPRKEIVYQNFSKNLDDIVQAGLKSGAKVLLNSVAVNLKDCAPFASMIDSHLPNMDRIRFNQLMANGTQAENQNNFTAAIQDFEQAAKLDSTFAELQYRWGKCLLALTNFPEARAHLQLACDTDALPFRADSRINDIIRSERKKADDKNLILVDAAGALANQTSEKICGDETFYEHVHFNFDGNYRLARVWAEQIEKILPASVLQNTASNDWATQESDENWLGLSDWNRSLVFESVIQRMQKPPLSEQLGNDARINTLKARLTQLTPQMNFAAAKKSRENFEMTLARRPDDYYAHENFALFLKSVSDLAGAVKQWRQVHNLIPQDSFATYQLGRLLELQGQFAEAESYLRAAVTMRPTATDVWIELGNTLALQNDFKSALAAYERARQQRPQDSQIIFLAGNALAKLNHHVEAIQDYREAIKLDSSNWEFHFELGGELDSQNRLSEACDEFAAATRLNPDNSRTHFNYGVLLAKQKRFDEAQREFEETIRLEPANQKARFYLTALQAAKK